MDKKINIVTLDWREFGDFSAVGQLTKKIFSFSDDFSIYPIQCIKGGNFCKLSKWTKNEGLNDFFGYSIPHDATLNFLKKISPNILYLRLSPNIKVLELALKILSACPNLKLIVHYMDKPHLEERVSSETIYIEKLYEHLIKKSCWIYVIHESVIQWVLYKYGRKSSVLRNFIDKECPISFDFKTLINKKINIYYFGGIDKKMNTSTIEFFCRKISNLPWIEFSIWSTTQDSWGNWGEIQKIIKESNNIKVHSSSIDESAYVEKLREADLLLIAYNIDNKSIDYLEHSFSNKLIDYLEAGRPIMCIGSDRIPTVDACKKLSNGVIVFENETQLSQALYSKEKFIGRLRNLSQESFCRQREDIKYNGINLIKDFFEKIKSISDQRSENNIHLRSEMKKKLNQDFYTKLMLSFLIKRKFIDHQNGNVQSLSASLMAYLLKKRGYNGFDYEI